MKFCNQDISKSMTARSFKLCQQIEENIMSRLLGENLKLFFFELLPFENMDIESLISQKLLQLGASNLDS